jgi:hypothetical protein
MEPLANITHRFTGFSLYPEKLPGIVSPVVPIPLPLVGRFYPLLNPFPAGVDHNAPGGIKSFPGVVFWERSLNHNLVG